jgi:hypothetical protein
MYSNAYASSAVYDSISGDSVAFQYNGRTSSKRKRCPRDIDSYRDSTESEDNAPLPESEDDSNDVDIVPSRKARRPVSPMVVRLRNVTHGFQTNYGNYCPSEGTDNDDSLAEEDMRTSSGGLSNDVAAVAAVADTSVAATTRHRKTTVDKRVHEDLVSRATVIIPRNMTIIE